MLKLKHVFKDYNNNMVLKDINLNLPSKGLISIVGVSGSGKSTLLNLVGGLDKVTKGNIYFNNKNITNLNTKELNWYHNKCVGFVFQSYNLIDYLSVNDNLSLINNNFDYILKKLDIYNLKDKKVSLLSGGEKQRVAIARAILKNPKILLCDEPTGALDTSSSIKTMELLKELSNRMLVIVVTHNMDLANTYSDYIIEIKDGKINSNIKVSDDNNKLIIGKPKKTKIYKIASYHLKHKRKRNLLISISFAIGLIALGLVLSINIGFKNSITKEEKNSLAKYPIIISKYSTYLEDNSIKQEENKIYAYDINHINIIDKTIVNNLEDINNNLSYKIYKYNINDRYYISSLINNDSFYNNYDLLYGNYINNKDEVLLILDNNNCINKYDLLQVGLKEDIYDYQNVINHEFKIDKKKYHIVGVLKAKDNSVLSDQAGILVDNSNFINNIPESIYLYPLDYDNKQVVINKLNQLDDIKYMDLSTTFKDISNNIIDGISIILIVFSIITLIVSGILIGILTYINIMEYKHEIGIYKSLGISNNSIKSIFFLENIMIIIRSFYIASIFIEIVSIPINKIIYNMTGLSDVIGESILIYLFMITISIIISLLSSYIPIRRISKMNIVDILRSE